MDRRIFMEAVASAMAAVAAAGPARARPPVTSKTVVLYGDEAPLSPQEQTVRLTALTTAFPDPVDRYLSGGAVAALEAAAAKMFGEPAAAFFPTGTMANNVAVRVLCGGDRLVVVQRDSHLYADESDAPAVLSGLTLAPLAPGRVSPTPAEVAAEIARWEGGVYPEKVGAVSLETPVRVHDGAFIPVEDVRAISQAARARGVRMHWDGARALLLLGTPGFQPAAMADLFDTVMLSLDKYLGAPTGALLIGDADHIAQARQVRHVFGGLMDHGWQLALPPLAALPSFEGEYAEARRRAAVILDGLRRTPGFEVRPVVDGTNITFVQVPPAAMADLRLRLARDDVRAALGKDGLMTFYTNTSLLRRPPESVLRTLVG